MTTISNRTDKIIKVYNDIFSINIYPNKTGNISDDILDRNSEFYFSYLDFTQSYRKIEQGLEKGGVRRRIYYSYEIQSHFPVITLFNLKDVSELLLEAEDVSLRKLLIFKTVYLKKILCNSVSSGNKKSKYMFCNEQDKQQFLKLMRMGNVITLPAAILTFFIMIGVLLSHDSLITKITLLFFLLGFTVVAAEDFYYTIKAGKWGIFPPLLK